MVMKVGGMQQRAIRKRLCVHCRSRFNPSNLVGQLVPDIRSHEVKKPSGQQVKSNARDAELLNHYLPPQPVSAHMATVMPFSRCPLAKLEEHSRHLSSCLTYASAPASNIS